MTQGYLGRRYRHYTPLIEFCIFKMKQKRIYRRLLQGAFNVCLVLN